MSNQQLKIFIKLISDRLSVEIENARNLLPDGLEMLTQKEYIGKGLSFFDKAPESWKDVELHPVALDGLVSFLAELRQMEETLEEETES